MSRSLCAIFAAALLLSSCSAGAGDEDIMAGIQSDFSSAGSVSFSAGIEADYGDRVYDYTVSWSGTAAGGTVTILEPDIVSGVTVEISGGAASLAYDGAEVYTGEILPGGLSPVDALPMLLDAFSQGLITETVKERWGDVDCLAALFRVDDRVSARAWFDIEAGLPLHGEVYLDGMTVITCDFYDMKVE